MPSAELFILFRIQLYTRNRRLLYEMSAQREHGSRRGGKLLRVSEFLVSKPGAHIGRRADRRAPKPEVSKLGLLRGRPGLRVVRREHARDQIGQLRVRGAQVPIRLRDRARRIYDKDLGRVHADRAVRQQVSVAVPKAGIEGLVLGAKHVAHAEGKKSTIPRQGKQM